ncbi:helix-turn-helix domain-containing protein [Hymenobacter guriensis]|uniref:Helix-turn-helix domain-containing protein n=1 Tax=Hymenobacter guriensis TaxID=2793065 RepID=A0ABS0L2P7_9BACT|nr:helix-turn-helix domain-containing protein [Hymenobacter guriensis]MBG8554374.1 helix-turn-helix domain-containing protein [Hymenobacter guriensis]
MKLNSLPAFYAACAEAKALLRQADWTLWEIADSLGFLDVAHFSHFFRHYAAVSPGAFRTLAAVPV